MLRRLPRSRCRSRPRPPEAVFDEQCLTQGSAGGQDRGRGSPDAMRHGHPRVQAPASRMQCSVCSQVRHCRKPEEMLHLQRRWRGRGRDSPGCDAPPAVEGRHFLVPRSSRDRGHGRGGFGNAPLATKAEAVTSHYNIHRRHTQIQHSWQSTGRGRGPQPAGLKPLGVAETEAAAARRGISQTSTPPAIEIKPRQPGRARRSRAHV